MKPKKLLAIILVVIVLMGLAFIKNQAANRDNLKKQEESPLFNLTNQISPSFISKIIIYKGNAPGQKLTLTKDSQENWIIENKFGIKARKPAIDNIFKEFSGLEGEGRSQSKAVYPDFEIEDNQSAHLILESDAGKVTNHFIISFKKPSWDSNFIRMDDSEKVFLTNKNLLGYLNLYSKDTALDNNFFNNFADYKIYSFKPEEIVKIELTQGTKKPLILVKDKEKNTWQIEGEKMEIDTAKVDEFIRNAANIYASDILDPAGKDYGFDKPLLKITLINHEDAGSAEISADIEIGNFIEKEKAYYLKDPSSNQIFKIPESQIKNLQKDRSFFVKAKK